jgi:hypothetical protein
LAKKLGDFLVDWENFGQLGDFWIKIEDWTNFGQLGGIFGELENPKSKPALEIGLWKLTGLRR